MFGFRMCEMVENMSFKWRLGSVGHHHQTWLLDEVNTVHNEGHQW